MLKDRIVRLKLVKHFAEQKPVSYVGKVTSFSDAWVVMEARGIVLARQQPSGVIIDKKPRAVVVPRDNVESIHVLPNNFDVENIKTDTRDQLIVLVVDGGRDAYLGEMGEG